MSTHVHVDNWNKYEQGKRSKQKEMQEKLCVMVKMFMESSLEQKLKRTHLYRINGIIARLFELHDTKKYIY